MEIKCKHASTIDEKIGSFAQAIREIFNFFPQYRDFCATLCIHHIKYKGILYSLWTTYLKSGLGELQSQHQPRNPVNPSVRPIPMKSRVKNSVRQGINENDACLVYVQNRLLDLEKGIQQAQINLKNPTKSLHDYLSLSIVHAIAKFFEKTL